MTDEERLASIRRLVEDPGTQSKSTYLSFTLAKYDEKVKELEELYSAIRDTDGYYRGIQEDREKVLTIAEKAVKRVLARKLRVKRTVSGTGGFRVVLITGHEDAIHYAQQLDEAKACARECRHYFRLALMEELRKELKDGD
jgi:hypothetical protein